MKAKLESYQEPHYRSTIEGPGETRRINEQVDKLTSGDARKARREREPRRLRFDRILVGTDGSKSSDVALDWAVALARLYDGRIDIAAVAGPYGGYARDKGLDKGGYVSEEDFAKRDLERALHRATRHGVDATTHLFRGSPVGELADAAQRFKSSLLVVGSHGRSAITRVVLGGTALGVINESPTNVLLARTKPPARRLLVPTDGSVASQEAALVGSDLKRAWKAEGTLLHVVPPPAYGPPEPARRLFNKLFAGFGRDPVAGTPYDVDIRFGPPAAQIATAARTRKADVILMGGRGLRGIRSLLAGSVSAAVIHRATTSSVLLVKEPTSELD